MCLPRFAPLEAKSWPSRGQKMGNWGPPLPRRRVPSSSLTHQVNYTKGAWPIEGSSQAPCGERAEREWLFKDSLSFAREQNKKAPKGLRHERA
jgi:hypothetical protein